MKNIQLPKNISQIWKIFSECGLPTVLLNHSGKILRYNQAMTEITGYFLPKGNNFEVYLSKVHLDGDYRNFVQKILQRLNNRMEAIKRDPFTIIRRDGKARQLLFSVYDLKNDEGKPVNLQIVQGVDITQEKKRELDNEKRAEERYNLLFNSIGSGVAVYEAINDGKDFIFKDLNNAGEKIDSIDKEELIGYKITEKFPGVKKMGLFDVLQRVWKTGKSEKILETNYEDDRISGWRDNHVYKLSTGEIVAIYDDISGNKQTEQQFLESEAKYRLLVENSLQGVAIIQDEIYVYVNSTFAKTTGYSKEELLKFSKGQLWEIIHPEDQIRLVERDKQLKNGLPVEPHCDFRYVNRDGEIRWVSSLASPIEYGGKPAFQIFESDVTEKRKAEEIQKELEGRREKFISMTTHELRTPITVISGYLHILAKRIDEISSIDRKKIFTVMKDNLSRLERLVGQVSLISQFEENIFKVNRKPLNFYSFFEETTEPYKNLLGDQFYIHKYENILENKINADKNRLKQVLENIINNAIDHTPPASRRIEIKFTINPDSIQITIGDNGAGISPENITRIFDQFVSIETEYSVTGTGVGLYLSKMIIKAHGGSISANSDGLGKGSTFIITLPK